MRLHLTFTVLFVAIAMSATLAGASVHVKQFNSSDVVVASDSYNSGDDIPIDIASAAVVTIQIYADSPSTEDIGQVTVNSSTHT